jgi:hypothetical protein
MGERPVSREDCMRKATAGPPRLGSGQAFYEVAAAISPRMMVSCYRPDSATTPYLRGPLGVESSTVADEKKGRNLILRK